MTNSSALLAVSGVTALIVGTAIWSMWTLEKTSLFAVKTSLVETPAGGLAITLIRPRVMWIAIAMLILKITLFVTGMGLGTISSLLVLFFLVLYLKDHSEKMIISKGGIQSVKGYSFVKNERNILFADVTAIATIPSALFKKVSASPRSSVSIRLSLGSEYFFVLAGVAAEDAKVALQRIETMGKLRLSNAEPATDDISRPKGLFESQLVRAVAMVLAMLIGIGFAFLMQKH